MSMNLRMILPFSKELSSRLLPVANILLSVSYSIWSCANLIRPSALICNFFLEARPGGAASGSGYSRPYALFFASDAPPACCELPALLAPGTFLSSFVLSCFEVTNSLPLVASLTTPPSTVEDLCSSAPSPFFRSLSGTYTPCTCYFSSL